MQALTTIILILRYIAYTTILNIRTLNLLLIKITNNYMPDAPFAGAASLSCQYGEFVNDLTRFNKIAIQGAPQMAVDKEAISLSRV